MPWNLCEKGPHWASRLCGTSRAGLVALPADVTSDGSLLLSQDSNNNEGCWYDRQPDLSPEAAKKKVSL